MTDQEKREIIEELRKEMQDDLAIYIGNNVLKGAAKIIGTGVLALGYYLISNGYLKV
jgi:hypothetical protein